MKPWFKLKRKVECQHQKPKSRLKIGGWADSKVNKSALFGMIKHLGILSPMVITFLTPQPTLAFPSLVSREFCTFFIYIFLIYFFALEL